MCGISCICIIISLQSSHNCMALAIITLYCWQILRLECTTGSGTVVLYHYCLILHGFTSEFFNTMNSMHRFFFFPMHLRFFFLNRQANSLILKLCSEMGNVAKDAYLWPSALPGSRPCCNTCSFACI